jgi:carbon starvation protein
MVWLVTITMTAGWQKIFSADTRVGFLSHADVLQNAIASGTMPAGIASADVARQLIFNDYLNTGVAAFFMLSVVVILTSSIREWALVLQGRKPAASTEVPFVSRPLPAAGD